MNLWRTPDQLAGVQLGDREDLLEEDEDGGEDEDEENVHVEEEHGEHGEVPARAEALPVCASAASGVRDIGQTPHAWFHWSNADLQLSSSSFVGFDADAGSYGDVSVAVRPSACLGPSVCSLPRRDGAGADGVSDGGALLAVMGGCMWPSRSTGVPLSVHCNALLQFDCGKQEWTALEKAAVTARRRRDSGEWESEADAAEELHIEQRRSFDSLLVAGQRLEEISREHGGSWLFAEQRVTAQTRKSMAAWGTDLLLVVWPPSLYVFSRSLQLWFVVHIEDGSMPFNCFLHSKDELHGEPEGADQHEDFSGKMEFHSFILPTAAKLDASLDAVCMIVSPLSVMSIYVHDTQQGVEIAHKDDGAVKPSRFVARRSRSQPIFRSVAVKELMEEDARMRGVPLEAAMLRGSGGVILRSNQEQIHSGKESVRTALRVLAGRAGSTFSQYARSAPLRVAREIVAGVFVGAYIILLHKPRKKAKGAAEVPLAVSRLDTGRGLGCAGAVLSELVLDGEPLLWSAGLSAVALDNDTFCVFGGRSEVRYFNILFTISLSSLVCKRWTFPKSTPPPSLGYAAVGLVGDCAVWFAGGFRSSSVYETLHFLKLKSGQTGELARCVRSLFDVETLSDLVVTLPRFSERKFSRHSADISLHRCILSARSAWFREWLRKHPDATVCDLDAEGYDFPPEGTFSVLLSLYSGDDVANPDELTLQQMELHGIANTTGNLEIYQNDLRELFHQRSSFSPVRVEFGDGGPTEFAHGALLACRSDYFLAMLGSRFLEASTGTIELPGRDRSIFVAVFLRWIYSGEVPDDIGPDMALDALPLASEFSASSLVASLSEIIYAAIDPESAPYVLYVAESLSLDTLRRRTIEYLERYRDDVLRGQGFEQYQAKCEYFRGHEWNESSEVSREARRRGIAIRKQIETASLVDRQRRFKEQAERERRRRAEAQRGKSEAYQQNLRLAESARALRAARRQGAQFRAKHEAAVHRAQKKRQGAPRVGSRAEDDEERRSRRAASLADFERRLEAAKQEELLKRAAHTAAVQRTKAETAAKRASATKTEPPAAEPVLDDAAEVIAAATPSPSLLLLVARTMALLLGLLLFSYVVSRPTE